LLKSLNPEIHTSCGRYLVQGIQFFDAIENAVLLGHSCEIRRLNSMQCTFWAPNGSEEKPCSGQDSDDPDEPFHTPGPYHV
jgi:hypothetical protein